MPSLKGEILILLKEGLLSDLPAPYHQFRIGRLLHPESFSRTILRLEQEGLIRKLRKDKKTRLLLTDKGNKFITGHREVVRSSPHSWDKKWRLVIFDIPEEKRRLRDYLRRYLKTLGFGKVQRSIWISPYDFSEIIQRYAGKLKLSDYIFQITADKFKGLSGAALVQNFWDLKDIHNKYLELIDRYTKRQAELAELIIKVPRGKDISKQIIKEYLLWDYQSIQSRDPRLPQEFLPDDWGGNKARKFIKSFPKTSRDR